MVIALAGINPWKDGYLQINIITWRKNVFQAPVLHGKKKMTTEVFQANIFTIRDAEGWFYGCSFKQTYAWGGMGIFGTSHIAHSVLSRLILCLSEAANHISTVMLQLSVLTSVGSCAWLKFLLTCMDCMSCSSKGPQWGISTSMQ